MPKASVMHAIVFAVNMPLHDRNRDKPHSSGSRIPPRSFASEDFADCFKNVVDADFLSVQYT